MFGDYELQALDLLRSTSNIPLNSIYLASFDEVGRGSVFGPVSVGSVLYPASLISDFNKLDWFNKVNDSKLLNVAERNLYFQYITKYFITKVEHTSVCYIDKYNINQAIQMGIYRIVQYFKRYLMYLSPDKNLSLLLLDGNYKFLYPSLTMQEAVPPIKTIIKGDQTVFTIACASVIAKVTRDELLMKVGKKKYTQYNIEKNKGYGTPEHLLAIKKYGLTKLHRKSFLKNVV